MRGVDNPPPASDAVKEKVELYLCFSAVYTARSRANFILLPIQSWFKFWVLPKLKKQMPALPWFRRRGTVNYCFWNISDLYSRGTELESWSPYLAIICVSRKPLQLTNRIQQCPVSSASQKIPRMLKKSDVKYRVHRSNKHHITKYMHKYVYTYIHTDRQTHLYSKDQQQSKSGTLQRSQFAFT